MNIERELIDIKNNKNVIKEENDKLKQENNNLKNEIEMVKNNQNNDVGVYRFKQ